MTAHRTRCFSAVGLAALLALAAGAAWGQVIRPEDLPPPPDPMPKVPFLTPELTPTRYKLQNPAALPEAPEWARAEAAVLGDYAQLTFPTEFTRAGEAYFDPTGTWIIFQATERAGPGKPAEKEGAGEAPKEAVPPSPYGMLVAKVIRNENGRIVGIEAPLRISPPGSANTCGWFDPRPQRAGLVIYSSTMRPIPADEASPGYQRGTGKYRWAFPPQMQMVAQFIPEYRADRGMPPPIGWLTDPNPQQPWSGYQAEASYSPDAKHTVFAAMNPRTQDIDLYVWGQTRQPMLLVSAKGYDGGPFFSPDGKRVAYRSDRTGEGNLQLFVADLTFDSDGFVTGVAVEHQLTDDKNVNWAPFWHPSGKFLVFASSAVGHDNYEVFSIEVPPPQAPRALPPPPPP
ncbi:MAG: PD40 domain-containing protein, partial [Phycisphaerales bacterium]|nr:PD40 domain-containing protein [Phycisphaerales bacterium]